MNNTVSINDLEHRGRNLWTYEGRYYRMYANGITPNNCWLIAPELRELVDIDVATGDDVYGPGRLEFDGVTGTVPSAFEYIRKPRV